MVVLELAMIVIGLGAVIYSFRMMQNHNEGQEGTSDNLTEHQTELTQKVEELVQEQKEELENRVEQIFQETDDRLSELSNEKIMGMSEYSDQVLDKIEKNHAEAVFLYDMLNEKQEEMKQLVAQMDSVKADLHNDAAIEYQNLKELEGELKELQIELETEFVKNSSDKGEIDTLSEVLAESSTPEPADAFQELLQDSSVEDEPVEQATNQTSVFDAEIARIEEEESKSLEQEKQYHSYKEEEIVNHNDEIISLYKKGRSVLEISKMLSMGQGEVKFVIDLYNAR